MNKEKYFKNPNSPFLLNIVQEGDGLELLRDLKDEVAQLVIFDPQYKPSSKVTNENCWRIKPFYYTTPNKTQSEKDISLFIGEITRSLKPNGYLIFWINRDILLQTGYHKYLSNVLKVKELLIWKKGNFLAMGSLTCPFRQASEYCLLIQKEPYKDRTKDRTVGNVFNETHSSYASAKNHSVHRKPLKMTETIIQQLTQEGDLVIDPCAGSFTVLRACHSLKRDFLGTDLTLRKLMRFNINKERSRKLLKLEGKIV